jgi:hypothetical protein
MKIGIFEVNSPKSGRKLCDKCFFDEGKKVDSNVKSNDEKKNEGYIPNSVETLHFHSYHLLYILAIISFLICFIAGMDMLSLESRTGNTVAEAYYNTMGVFVIGMGFLSTGILIGLGMIIDILKKNY